MDTGYLMSLRGASFTEVFDSKCKHYHYDSSPDPKAQNMVHKTIFKVILYGCEMCNRTWRRHEL
jgi:hypothetical protein